MEEKILSREKRKMWTTFSKIVHILWCVCRKALRFNGDAPFDFSRLLLVSCLAETFYMIPRASIPYER